MRTRLGMGIALGVLSAIFGFSIGSARALRAEGGTWKHCTEVNQKGACITCKPKVDCGDNEICCNPNAEE